MKKILILLLALSLTGCSSVTKTAASKGEVVDCVEVDHVAAKSDDTLLNCLTGSEKISVESLRGPLIVNVWGSWCGPCKQEMPYFVELYQNPLFKNGQIQLLGINVEEKSKPQLTLYPNPTRLDYVEINGIDVNDIQEVNIYDLSGREVYHYSHRLLPGENIIDMNNLGLAKGTYYLDFQTESVSRQAKMIAQ